MISFANLAQLKVGDQVIIRPDLAVKEYCGSHYISVTEDMLIYAGKKTTVMENHNTSVFLEISGKEWYWDDEMLIPCGSSDNPLLII